MKRLAIAFSLLIAGLFMSVPAANAQSIGVQIGGRHGGVSIEFGTPYGYGYGYGHRGCYDCGRPVYRDRGCYDCGGYDRDYDRDYDRGYDYHAPISVRVYVREVYRDRVWDGYCGCSRIIERVVSVPRQVIAYWDNYRGGYWYVDGYGNRVPVNY